MTQTIDPHSPLAFRCAEGSGIFDLRRGQDGADTIKVEARQMTGHQKEAIVTEGRNGDSWRLPSDEGAHLKGSDLAPFPLGFFNAGLQGDLFHHISHVFGEHKESLQDVTIELVNHYWLTGSFALGTGQGHAEPTEIRIRVESAASASTVATLVRLALDQSPAIDLLRTPIENTFALYINGRRRRVEGIPRSDASDASDPFLTYRSAPLPVGGRTSADLIAKSERTEAIYPNAVPTGSPPRTIRNVHGLGRLEASSEQTNIESWLELPSASHFLFRSATGNNANAPSGLALLSAGVAFCFMTQLARYIETMKMAIKGVRMVQLSPYTIEAGKGRAFPIDTHLFLNGDAPEETHLRLLLIAAHTCYLHATAAARIEPLIEIFHNGVKIE
jgi:uncharacterized OsmC-like protein